MHRQKREVRDLTEANALKELKNGSEKALEWFIKAYTPYVTTVIHNIIGAHMDMSDVEEVAADVFYKLWENAGSVYSVKGYLGTVARNLAKNKCREMGFDLPLEDQILVVDELTPESRMEKKELNRAVKLAVLGMPYPDREIFLRHYYYCQTMEAISAKMGINLSTVKTKLRRGRIRLRSALIQYIT